MIAHAKAARPLAGSTKLCSCTALPCLPCPSSSKSSGIAMMVISSKLYWKLDSSLQHHIIATSIEPVLADLVLTSVKELMNTNMLLFWHGTCHKQCRMSVSLVQLVCSSIDAGWECVLVHAGLQDLSIHAGDSVLFLQPCMQKQVKFPMP